MGERVRIIDILLVEDNPGDVDLTKIELERGRLRNRLHVVTDGTDALKFLRKKPPFEDAVRPGLILLDLGLPVMGGMELLQIIKKDSELCPIPVFVLTDSDDPRMVLDSFKSYASGYLPKPLDVVKLVSAVTTTLGPWIAIVAE